MTSALTDSPTAPSNPPHGSLQALMGPGLRVQSFATLVETSPAFDIDVLQTCIDAIADPTAKTQAQAAVTALAQANTDLASAKTHGVTWRTVILPDMFSTNTGIQAYGVALKAVLTDLQTKQAALGPNATAEQKVAFLTMALPELKAMEHALTSYSASASSLKDGLNTLVTNLAQDTTNFTQDNTTIQAVAGGESTLIQGLNDEITACHDAINKDIGLIVGGAVVGLAGIGMCVVGALIVVGTVGAGAPVAAGLIIGGVLVAGAGAAMMSVGGIDLHSKQNELSNATAELTAIQGAVSAFTSSSSILTHFAASASDAHAAATQLAAMWDDERSKLTGVAQTVQVAIDSADPTCLDILSLFMSSALDDWAPVAELSHDIDLALTGLSQNQVTSSLQQTSAKAAA